MHAIQYVRYLCETSDISTEFWYVSHRYLTSWMVLSTPLQLSKMLHRSELPDSGFALKEIAGLSENVSASCNHAQHRIWRYNVWIWIKYCSISESATKQHKNFEICEMKMGGYQNSSLTRAAVEVREVGNKSSTTDHVNVYHTIFDPGRNRCCVNFSGVFSIS